MSPWDRVELLKALLKDLPARAAGLWRLEGDRLIQVAFFSCDDMPEEVARRFGEATRIATLDQSSLGIVKAVVEGRTVVSIADELPSATGSGHWLRAFGADRSIAVPLRSAPGVVSVAVLGLSRPAEEIERALRSLMDEARP